MRTAANYLDEGVSVQDWIELNQPPMVVVAEINRIRQLAKALYADKCLLEIRIAELELAIDACKCQTAVV